jgi:hypothetical protein
MIFFYEEQGKTLECIDKFETTKEEQMKQNHHHLLRACCVPGTILIALIYSLM